jgi:DNA transposition AAA+ family ATPase
MDKTDSKPTPAKGAELFHGAGRWDDVTIQGEAMAFPEAVRGHYIWLKTYAREQCAKDIDRVTEAFKQAGVFRDSTTWSKILRGLCFKDAKGARRASPVIAAENFAIEVDALRSGTRLEAMRGRIPFVMTTTAQSIFDYLDLSRRPERGNGFAVIVGPTGAQKTATFKEYQLQRNHGSTRWFEAPENGAMMELVTRLAGDMSAQTASDKKKAHLLKALKPTMLIIIDNAQELFRADDEKQPAFSYLRRLNDETGCRFALSFTPTGLRLVQKLTGYWEQFEGRSGGSRKWLRLQEHAPEADVQKIAEAFGLVDAKKHLKELMAISREPGRIRRLFEDLQDGKQLAGTGALTIEDIREARGDV